MVKKRIVKRQLFDCNDLLKKNKSNLKIELNNEKHISFNLF